jgi:predicted  nucleic acid-binding Zn-ribbon protein
MSNKLLEYQELDKKLKKIKKEENTLSAEKVVENLNKVIKDSQAKILELEETSKKLLETLNKLMEVQKKGISYVEKCNNVNIDDMSEAELKDFDLKTSQTAKQLAELDTRIASHNAEVKKVVLDYKMYRKKILDAKEKRESLKTSTTEKTEQSAPQVDDLKKQMAKLEKEIEPAKLAKYKALKQDGIFPVIVPLVDRRCGGCRMELSTAALDKLKNKGVHECEQCRRLIFIENE